MSFELDETNLDQRRQSFAADRRRKLRGKANELEFTIESKD
jgi:hypothetical protein